MAAGGQELSVAGGRFSAQSICVRCVRIPADDMTPTDLCKMLLDSFADDIAVDPEVTLRGGNHMDDHSAPPPYDPVTDKISDEYMESFHWGVAYLDPASWRHYLPQLADYVVRHFNRGTLVGEATIASLCAPDHDPPRLATLTPRQEQAVTEFLEFLAFTDGSAHQVSACCAIDEWWSPDAIYRIRPASLNSKELL